MKKILVLLSIVCLGTFANAKSKPSPFSPDDDGGWINMAPDSASEDTINSIETNLLSFLQGMNGISGAGESLCDEATGVQYTKLTAGQRSQAQLVRCIVIFTENQKADDAVDALMPVGHKYSQIYILHHM